MADEHSELQFATAPELLEVIADIAGIPEYLTSKSSAFLLHEPHL